MILFLYRFLLDSGDDLQGGPGEYCQDGRGTALRHSEQGLLGVDLDGGDPAPRPQEPQLPGLDVQEVEEVTRGVEERPRVKDVEVVAPRAVVAEAVTEAEAVPGKVAANLRGVSLRLGLELLLRDLGGLDAGHHLPVHGVQVPEQLTSHALSGGGRILLVSHVLGLERL